MNHKKNIVAFLSSDSNALENEKWNKNFWSNVSDEDKFAAAWNLIEVAWLTNGRDLRELRLKRTVGLFKPA